MNTYYLRAASVLISIAIAGGVMACGSTDPTATQVPTEPPPSATSEPGEPPSVGALAEPDETWTVVTESSALNAILATPDLAPGTRRFAVVLTDDRGIVALPVVQLSTYRYPDGMEVLGNRDGPIETQKGRFYPFPFGSRGLHATELTFDVAGVWGVEARIPRPDGEIEFVEVLFHVGEETKSVDVGEMPPRVASRTLDDVSDISDLTTGSSRYPDLYQISVPDAMDSGKPTVVVFASPAFCTNAVCGPQVEVLNNLSEDYGGDANFIHVDLYENPQEIQGDLSRGMPSPLLDEWGLVSQEWSFVMDEKGVVVGRFENFAPEEELESTLISVLDGAEN